MNAANVGSAGRAGHTGWMAREFSVSPQGSADFRTIGEALDAVEALRTATPAEPKSLQDEKRIRITIGPGIYREKIAVWQPNVPLRGAGIGLTVIAWDDCAKRLLPDGQPMGTFNSYTVYIGARGVSLQGLTIENSAGDGRLVGPAVALLRRRRPPPCRRLPDSIQTGYPLYRPPA